MAKVLIIGGGGREHALAWKMAKSPKVDHVFVAPGNGGTALEANITNVAIDVMDQAALLHFAKDNAIDLTVVGPEAPLVAGIVDHFQQAELAIFGPCQQAAQLEGSKAFSKHFMEKYNIPTAHYQTFTDVDSAKNYVKAKGTPIVIKASGLAAGKGVIIAADQEQAFGAIESMLTDQHFGDAGHEIVIEEFLTGEEASFIALVDGKHCLPLATSQDHKALLDGDKGPNTGGMGAYSPAPVLNEALQQRAIDEIMLPVINAMAEQGHPYRGFLYAGLMIDNQSNPKVLEFNCRMGDPETQPIMMRLQSDLYTLCLQGATGQLANGAIQWDPRPALGIVLAADGYPEKYHKGDIIKGINHNNQEHIKVFHAGTKLEGDNIITNGGRVICVTALGNTVNDAQKQAYQCVKDIHWPGIYYRKDIGYRAA